MQVPLDGLRPSLDCNVGILKVRDTSLDDVLGWFVLVSNLGLEAAQELQRGLV